MSWDKDIDELKHRVTLAHKMGGDEKVARQHEFGKLTIRERVDAIVDDKSFHEIGTLAGVAQYNDEGELQSFMPSNFVFGTAEIDDRPVIVSGDDFTVRGGSADASIAGKRLRSEGLACELRLPHVRLIDGMGGGGSVKTIEMAGRTYISRGSRVGKSRQSSQYCTQRGACTWQRCRDWSCSRCDKSLFGDCGKHRANDDCGPRFGRLG